MLVLNRTPGEKVMLGDEIIVMVLKVNGNQVRIGFSAPDELSIHREEIYRKIKRKALNKTKIVYRNHSIKTL